MKIRELCDVISATVICGEEKLDADVFTACASDMMSDVLAFVKEQAVLLTGLTNPQVVRTAEMMDMQCIVFVRGKRPDETTINLAKAKGTVILSSGLRMYTACGLLYNHGLLGGENL